MKRVQSYANHARYQPLQHFVWLPLSLLLIISTVVYTVFQFVKHGFSFQLLLLVGVVILAIIPGMLARIYAITLQDRLIQNEEKFRYFFLTGKGLDHRLTKEQIIALRFASDEELAMLVARTIEENLSPDDIKKNIKTWRVDHHRV